MWHWSDIAQPNLTLPKIRLGILQYRQITLT